MTVKDEEIEEEEGGDDSETVCPEGITCLARPFKNDLKKRGRVKRKREKVVKGTRRTRRKRPLAKFFWPKKMKKIGTDYIGTNNCEISKMSFWRSKNYRPYFNHLDKTGHIYDSRWGDSPIKTLTTFLLLRDEQICYFVNDVTYTHQSWLPAVVPTSQDEEGGMKSWSRGLHLDFKYRNLTDSGDDRGSEQGEKELDILEEVDVEFETSGFFLFLPPHHPDRPSG
mmetsp:Transcript_28002/g.43688  ORF Transcript_28002/g.43688 Transcript_28002/m.43688 type:complete len:225 (-) Transcript_28002:311-985(-)